MPYLTVVPGTIAFLSRVLWTIEDVLRDYDNVAASKLSGITSALSPVFDFEQHLLCVVLRTETIVNSPVLARKLNTKPRPRAVLPPAPLRS